MTSINASERIWLIWSNEHRAWWGPGSMGYVGNYIRDIVHDLRYKEADRPVLRVLPSFGSTL